MTIPRHPLTIVGIVVVAFGLFGVVTATTTSPFTVHTPARQAIGMSVVNVVAGLMMLGLAVLAERSD